MKLFLALPFITAVLCKTVYNDFQDIKQALKAGRPVDMDIIEGIRDLRKRKQARKAAAHLGHVLSPSAYTKGVSRGSKKLGSKWRDVKKAGNKRRDVKKPYSKRRDAKKHDNKPRDAKKHDNAGLRSRVEKLERELDKLKHRHHPKQHDRSHKKAVAKHGKKHGKRRGIWRKAHKAALGKKKHHGKRAGKKIHHQLRRGTAQKRREHKHGKGHAGRRHAVKHHNKHGKGRAGRHHTKQRHGKGHKGQKHVHAPKVKAMDCTLVLE